MKASQSILTGVSALALLAMTACAPTVYVDSTVSARQAAQECVEDIESSKKAPQIMTYNSETKVETHVQTFPDGATMTVQDKDNNKVTGVDAKLGERPYSCYANGRDVNKSSRIEGSEAKKRAEGYKGSKSKGLFGMFGG